MVGRILIEAIRPVVDCGQWPARAVVGQRLGIEATVFTDGHDPLGARVRLTGPDGARREVPMAEVGEGLDRWRGEAVLDEQGMWEFVVEAWTDAYAAWRDKAITKLDAAQDIGLELEEGARLLEAAARRVPPAPGSGRTPAREALLLAVKGLRGDGTQAERLAAAVTDEVLELLAAEPLRRHVTRSRRNRVWVDRGRALFGAWYEFFPRSEGATATTGGTFRTAAERLPAIAEMGFDVVYLPPIHPIGRTYRKGRNNALEPGPDDPGSPWAIGSEEGGHDAVHPDLGTLDDFRAFVAQAAELGIEVALDYALQCSPDHPWVKEHPEWFTTRPDGSIAYAENPPKKYQDIYPLNFDSADAHGLWQACREVLEHWIGQGVRIFRVDNPHTKPVRFWEWLIATVKRDHPDVLFLSEAFTRPPMMRALAKVGFSQSYTYFTWRNTKQELEDYLQELAHGQAADYLRPNLFVNTPDILHAFLQEGGPPAFKIRAVLASMASPSWGVYSGYELFERAPARPASEEYLDSEKFAYRPRDWDQPSLAPYLATLNRVRHEHPALRRLDNLRFHLVDDDHVLAFSKREGDDAVLVVVSVDPHRVREANVHLWLPALGLGWEDAYTVTDQITGTSYDWQGATNFVRLDPEAEPAHVFTIAGGGHP
jgi:starch synthase (maltosyl-transferring)